jgi:hypothetical protein
LEREHLCSAIYLWRRAEDLGVPLTSLTRTATSTYTLSVLKVTNGPDYEGSRFGSTDFVATGIARDLPLRREPGRTLRSTVEFADTVEFFRAQRQQKSSS